MNATSCLLGTCRQMLSMISGCIMDGYHFVFVDGLRLAPKLSMSEPYIASGEGRGPLCAVQLLHATTNL